MRNKECQKKIKFSNKQFMFVNKRVLKRHWFENIEFTGECVHFFCYIFKSIIKILNK